MRLPRILLALLLLAAPGAAAADERDDLRRQNLLLEKELELSKGTGVYALFDLAAGQIAIKARGTLLRSFPVQSHRTWGHPPRDVQVKVAEKRPLPRRPEVVPDAPGTEEAPSPASSADTPAAPAEPKALELGDMPDDYTLLLDNGVLVSIRAGGGPRRFLRWYLGSPLRSLVGFLQGKPYRVVSLVLAADDSRALYWSLPEGTSCIFVFP